jgi:LmbE family N-acetylglucosaminyl deacetylase
MRILAIAAHPDDEVLGCAGTLKKWSTSHEVHVAILGEGISSRHAQRSDADQAAIARLRGDAERVSQLLGARSLTMEGLPDNRFDELALLDVVKRVEGLIDTLRPEVIFTHHPGDLNLDHGITFRAVLTATRPMSGTPVKEIYAFEVPSATEWAFQQIQPPFRPNVFIDVTETIEIKVEAMAFYESEARQFPHPRSPEALRTIARRWGSVVGLQYAEAFELIRSIRTT